MRRLVAALLASAAAASLAACQGADASTDATPTEAIAQLESDQLPAELGGLTVQHEDMAATLQNARRSYVEAVGLYSLRKEELLQATLQISRFNDNADVDAAFRRTAVQQVGGTRPQELRVGDDTVWATRGTRQRLFSWFRGRHMLVLAVRDEHPTPLGLLREALEVEL